MTHTITDPDLGRLQVDTVPLPEGWLHPWGTYTATGTILVGYGTADNPAEPGWRNLAVVNDDGSDVRHLFSGFAPLRPRNNGMRLLPFADGNRVLLDDWILECEPSVDACEQATMVPLLYPAVVEDDPMAIHRWSEPIIAPDNESICWTTLHLSAGAYNVLGTLRREADRYVVDHPQLVSHYSALTPDPDREGYVTVSQIRGGEVKQFVRGGAALSLAGTTGRTLVDSVLQDLDGEGLTALTLTPGYDETTILSPDETLGNVMTTRFSPRTNCAVVGLLPRPLAAMSAAGIAMAAYWYAVGGVREIRPGSIGPALVDLSKATTDPAYLGADLSDPEQIWVYRSPMSWHPDSTRAAWNESVRGTGRQQTRIRTVRLLDRPAGSAVPAVPTPTDIPYARPLTAETIAPTRGQDGGRIAGKVAGYVDLHRTGGEGLLAATTTETTYVGYSDDGRTFLDGTERLETAGGSATTTYEADLVRSGDDPGEMKLRLLFTQDSFADPVMLSFETAADGLPASHGHTTYAGTTLRVADMEP